MSLLLFTSSMLPRVSVAPKGSDYIRVTTNSMSPVVYRHSVVKRSDEDHITIWVHSSYNETFVAEKTEDETPAIQERGVLLPYPERCKTGGEWGSTYVDACGHSSFTSLTDPNRGAFTGGVHEITAWGKANRGSFHLHRHTRDNSKHEGLIIAAPTAARTPSSWQ